MQKTKKIHNKKAILISCLSIGAIIALGAGIGIGYVVGHKGGVKEAETRALHFDNMPTIDHWKVGVPVETNPLIIKDNSDTTVTGCEFTATDLPNGLSIDGQTGIISGTPIGVKEESTDSDLGLHNIKISVTSFDSPWKGNTDRDVLSVYLLQSLHFEYQEPSSMGCFKDWDFSTYPLVVTDDAGRTVSGLEYTLYRATDGTSNLLPQGLAFDNTNGKISGKITDDISSDAAMNFTISCISVDPRWGDLDTPTTDPFTINIWKNNPTSIKFVNATLPSVISCFFDDANFTTPAISQTNEIVVKDSYNEIVPNGTGIQYSLGDYSSNPTTLPGGLSMAPTTGVISGTPTTDTNDLTFTIKATPQAGSPWQSITPETSAACFTRTAQPKIEKFTGPDNLIFSSSSNCTSNNNHTNDAWKAFDGNNNYGTYATVSPRSYANSTGYPWIGIKEGTRNDGYHVNIENIAYISLRATDPTPKFLCRFVTDVKDDGSGDPSGATILREGMGGNGFTFPRVWAVPYDSQKTLYHSIYLIGQGAYTGQRYTSININDFQIWY